MVSRVLCLHLPFFRVERLERTRDALARQAFCVFQKQGRYLRILEASEKARMAGVQGLTTVSEARALCPELEALPAMLLEDSEELTQLALSLQSYTPRVGLYGARSLLAFLDSESRVFGGEEPLLEQVMGAIKGIGYTVYGAIATSPAAAYAFAAFDKEPKRCVKAEEQEQRLGNLPVLALRPHYRELEWLHALGLRRLEQIFAMPTGELALRFPELPGRLEALRDEHFDQGWQRVRGTLFYEERFEFDQPLRSRRRLLKVLEKLLERIYKRLQASRGARAIRRLRLQLDDFEHVMAFRKPCAEPQLAGRLIEQQLETIARLRQPVEALSIEVLELAEGTSSIRGLFDQGSDLEAFEKLLEKLTARLGATNVCGVRLCSDHRPERCFEYFPFGEKSLPGPELSGKNYRPLRLYRRAQRISVEKKGAEICRLRGRFRSAVIKISLGPERIRHGFWDELVDRDYYAIKTAQGVWLWIFEDRLGKEWYEHGLFD
jgi:protein ImuB